jgi:Anti-sigma-K factor rskA
VKLRRHEIHGLTGAYALDAVTGPELERFEHHVGRCPACDNEVRGFRETATQLALAVAATPPPQLRPRVLATVATTRQLPPEVQPAAPARRRGPRPGRAGRGGLLPRLATAGVAVLAAAAVAAAVVLGVRQSDVQHQLTQAQARTHAVAAVLAAPDARLARSTTKVGGVATVVSSQSRHAVIITTAGLPALAGGKVYELWFVAGTSARRAGLLPAPVAGRTAPLLARGLVRGDAVALTVEPAGGTNKPTTTPILALAVPA